MHPPLVIAQIVLNWPNQHATSVTILFTCHWISKSYLLNTYHKWTVYSNPDVLVNAIWTWKLGIFFIVINKPMFSNALKWSKRRWIMHSLGEHLVLLVLAYLKYNMLTSNAKTIKKNTHAVVGWTFKISKFIQSNQFILSFNFLLNHVVYIFFLEMALLEAWFV